MIEPPQERPRRYPLARRRRSPWWRRLYRWLRPFAARLPSLSPARVAAAAILASMALVAGYLIHRSHRPDPVMERAMALATLAKGNYSAARRHAQAAVIVLPRSGEPHALLARVALAQGDGVVAEGELARAAAYGWDRRRGQAMLAEARLLQGDADGAIELAAKVAANAPADQIALAGRVTARAQAANGDVPAAQASLASVLAHAPGDAGAWRDLARIRFEADDVLGATEAVNRALALARSDPDLLVLEGEIVRRRYGLAAALPWFRAALALDAYHVPALLDAAATLGDMGRYPEMLDAADRALAARPGEPRALYLLAVMAARAGQADLARAMLVHAGTAIVHVPGALLLSGVLDWQAGKLEHAIGSWRELVGSQPYNIVARRLLGMALLRSGDARGALDVLRPVTQRADADSYGLTLAARGFETRGGRDMAATLLDRAAAPASGAAPFGSDDDVETLQQAVAQAPTDPIRVLELVRSLVQAQRYPGALSLAKALAEDGPGAPEAWRLVGDVQVAMNRPGDAAIAYAHAADLAFDEPTMLRLVSALAESAQRVPAARVLALYLAQNPASVPAMRMAAGLQVQAGDWSHAIATLERLRARIGNRDAVILAQLSAAYLGAGDAAAARACGRAAYALQPMSAAAADAYGWSLYALGDDTGARDLLRKAAVLAPGDPAITAHLAAATAR